MPRRYDDPFALVKLMPEIAKQNTAVESVAAKRAELNPNRFMAYKVSLCGAQIKRDFRTGLTHEQARSFPLGKQRDEAGDYVWSYGVQGLTP